MTPDFVEGFFWGIGAVVMLLSWLHVRAQNARVDARRREFDDPLGLNEEPH